MMIEKTIMAWDTASPWCSAALIRFSPAGGQVLASYKSNEGPSHSRILAPVLEKLLKEAGLSVADLDILAAGRGPGSFTGLRTALSLAKGLALGAGLPLYTFSTLDILAAPWFRDDYRQVLTLLDARHQEVFAALYEKDASGHWRSLGKPQALAPDKIWNLLDGLSGPIKISGPGVDILEKVPFALSQKADISADAPEAAVLARMAYEQSARGEKPEAALHFYLRQPDIR